LDVVATMQLWWAAAAVTLRIGRKSYALFAFARRPLEWVLAAATCLFCPLSGARAELPEIILLDLMMPEVSGFDVVGALKGDARTRDIPIVIVTAKDVTAAEKNQLAAQVTAILAKGSSVRVELLTWLRQIPQPAQQQEAA
jgi:CheY-like chemotaxis protein